MRRASAIVMTFVTVGGALVYILSILLSTILNVTTAGTHRGLENYRITF